MTPEKHANIDLWKSAPLAEIDNPHPKNPRKIPAEDSDEIRTLDASLEHDYFDPLIWNKRNRMWVSGHVRAWRMRVKGYTHLDVVVVDYDEDTHLARMLAANAHSGTNDDDKLATLLTSLRESQVDPVLALMASLPEAPVPPGDADAEPQIDRAEELNKIWQVKPGDVWQIGPHRIMCGSSTEAEDVKKLMAGSLADLCFTSPPYAQQRDYTSDSDVSDWDALMVGVFKNAMLSDAGQIIVNLGITHSDGEWQDYWHAWVEWMRSQGWRRFGWYVWDQMHGLRGDFHGRCAPSHEFIFHFNKKSVPIVKWMDCKFAGQSCGGALRSPNGDLPGITGTDLIQKTKVPDSVWRVQRQKGGIEGHPAPFSSEFASIALRSWGGACYDPFLGSGTTMLAAQNLGRICYGMEISPGYCAVILDRMQRAFPDLEIKRVE